MRPVYRFLLIIFFLTVKNVFGQEENNSMLDKKISLEAKAEPIGSILDRISAQANVFFSYDALLIKAELPKDISVANESIRKTLDRLFDDQFEYKVIGDQIVITCVKENTVKKKEPGPENNKPGIIIFKGKIFDKDRKDVLPYANVFILKENMGTVSNNDGEFILKIPESMIRDTVFISCLGYKQQARAISEIVDKSYDIYLDPVSIQLKEIRVTVVNPQDIIMKILAKIQLNYSREPEIMKSFYREVLKQDDKYIDVAEALMEIRKSAYDNSFAQDKIKVIRGRKSVNVKSFQFIDFKLQGGPYYITKLDVMKTLDSFLDPEFIGLYKYWIDGMEMVDNRTTYIILFKPKEKIDDLCYQGKLYVDMSTLALVRAEFSLSRAGLKYARESLIKKKPKDLYVRPFDVFYQVNYQRANNKWHLSTARASVKFRIKSKSERVNSVFHSDSELLITDFKPDDGSSFRRNELFSSKDIFTKVVSNYNDGFWGDYNIIIPTEELRKSFQNYTMKSDSLFSGANDHLLKR
jgi:hypothetical protein